MFAHIALLGLAAVAGAGGSQPASRAPRTADVANRPRVEVWTSRGDDPYARGDGVRVFRVQPLHAVREGVHAARRLTEGGREIVSAGS